MSIKELENVNLFDSSTTEETLSVFDNKTTNQDGIYRPKLEDAKDKKSGYRAVIRFLPNLLKTGKAGLPAIERHLHYADFKNEPTLAAYYDCKKNFDPKCDLCTMYWKLYNSKNAADQERAKLISRQTRYYSYILVIEDDQHPELVGKVLIYPYGYTIKEKIKSEKNGDVSDKCNVFDLVKGKDFVLIIKEKGGFANYDASSFKESSPIKIYDDSSKSWKVVPVEKVTDDKGITIEKITNTTAQKKINEMLLSRTVELDEYLPKPWDDETQHKVNQIIEILAGNEYTSAQRASNSGGSTTSSSNTSSSVSEDMSDSVVSADDFFGADEE